MFEQLEYTQLKKGETYYIRLSERLGYIFVVDSFSQFVSCKNVQLYNFKTKIIDHLVTPYSEPCLFSKYEKYLRPISRKEFMNKLNEIHQRNMTNKILQNILDDNFKYYL
uniref:Uncharacterized protein n=1 Tax=viral metagenome TaxID=1070528 RepID=A0A6C0D035_9ZZZZ